VPVVLGSRSTYTLGALGGFKGRPLEAGDKLPVGKGRAAKEGRTFRKSCAAWPECPPNSACCRASTGTASPPRRASISSRTPGRWRPRPTASAIASRAAGRSSSCRASHPSARAPIPPTSSTACYPYGSIQIPSGTEPIVLHRDAVSGGGYFMVGTVISADMDLIGQLQPHTPAKFVEVTMAQALKARKDRAKLIDKIRAAL
jgi:allophanate hydrolase subunit 2